MKYNLLVTQLFALLFAFPCFSQVEWNEKNQSAQMEGIIQISGVSSEKLYERSKLWLLKNNIPQNEQTTSDQDSIKQLFGSGSLILSGGFNTRTRKLNFNVELHIKEGRLKYIFNKLVLIDYSATITSSEGAPTYQILDPLYEKRYKKKQEKKDVQLLIDEKLYSLIKTLSSTVNQKNDSEGW